MAGERKPLLQDAAASLSAEGPSMRAVRSTRNPKRFLPQAIAHRGYKDAYPENTMGAFEGAVEVGAHAIETDLHLSSDGVVVLSHDGTAKRCFGVDRKINECDWEFLSGLETLREPKQRMPRLRDLLEFLNKPGNEHIWVLLDVKLDDTADDLLGALARTFEEIPSGKTPWNQRIVLGLWNATFLQTAHRLLPTYSNFLITFRLPYAYHFFPIPNLGFNMYQRSLIGPLGSRFLEKARAADRPVLAWTVNDERAMAWCIRRNAKRRQSNNKEEDETSEKVNVIDGVITDDPKLYLEVCKTWEDEQDGLTPPTKPYRDIKGGLNFLSWAMIYFVFSRVFFLMGRRHGKFDYFKDVKTLKT